MTFLIAARRHPSNLLRVEVVDVYPEQREEFDGGLFMCSSFE